MIYRKFKHGAGAPKARPPLTLFLLPLLALAVVIAGAALYVRRQAQEEAAAAAAVKAEESKPTGKLPTLEAQAAELGCPRDMRPPASMAEKANEDPLPEGWLGDIAGWNRMNSDERKDGTIVILFNVPWCNFGRAAERSFTSEGPVKARLEKVVKVRINPESGPEEAKIADEFGVHSYPSIFVRKAGKVSPRVQLFRDVEGGIVIAPPQEILRALGEAGL